MTPTDLTTWTPTTDVNLADLATFSITGPETAEIAVEYREGVKALIAEIEAVYRPHIKRAHAAHKAIVGFIREIKAERRVVDYPIPSEL